MEPRWTPELLSEWSRAADDFSLDTLSREMCIRKPAHTNSASVASHLRVWLGMSFVCFQQEHEIPAEPHCAELRATRWRGVGWEHEELEESGGKITATNACWQPAAKPESSVSTRLYNYSSFPRSGNECCDCCIPVCDIYDTQCYLCNCYVCFYVVQLGWSWG